MVFRSKAEPQGRQVLETDFLRVSRMELKEMTTESCGGATVMVFKMIFIEETINGTTYNLQSQAPWHQMC